MTYSILISKKNILFSLTVTVFISAAIISSTLKAESKSEDINGFIKNFDTNIKKVTLENGLRLIMVRKTFAPTVSAYIKIKSGGVDETEKTAGIAHMLEHMLFKGTPSIGTKNYKTEKKYLELVIRWADRVDDLKRRIENTTSAAEKENLQKEYEIWQKRLDSIRSLARTFAVFDEDSSIYSFNGQQGYNAYTSRDLTNYQVSLPSNRLEVWASLESDRMQNSVLRDFYTERDVVTEERRMRVENVSSSLLIEEFLEGAFGNHAYGRSLIGSLKSIQNLNYNQAMSFYKTYYAPNNTVIALVGNLEFDQTEKLVRNYFGNMKPKIIPEPHIGEMPKQPFRVELKKEGSPVQMHAWEKPTMPDIDDLRLSVLGEILAGGKDSRLFKKLVLKDKTATSISVFSSFPGERYKNLFMLYSVPSPGNSYDTVENAILEELDGIKTNGITEEELKRAANKIEADFIYRLRDNSNLANEISYYELLTGDYKNMYKMLIDLNDIKTSDLQTAASLYLKKESMHRARLIAPEGNKQ